MKPTDYTHVTIHRNARGSYSILFKDGSIAASFVPSAREAAKHAAHIDAQEIALAARRAAEVRP
jgi:hypothetical protein